MGRSCSWARAALARRGTAQTRASCRTRIEKTQNPGDRVMAARWIVMAAALGCLAGCSRSTPPEPSQPYNTSIKLRDLMEHVMDPTADVVWGASGTMVDFEGEHDL